LTLQDSVMQLNQLVSV